MILYHAITAYHLLGFVIKQLERKEKATLIAAKSLLNVYKNYDYLIENNIFNEIIEINYPSFDDIDTMDNFITKFMENIEISQFDEFHIAGTHYPISYYLIKNKIRYYYYEESSGVLSRPEPLSNIVKGIYKLYDDMALKYKLYTGDNQFTIKKYCNLHAQEKGFQDDLAEDFNIIDHILKLDEDSRILAINFFAESGVIKIPEDSVLFLTEHFVNLNVLSFENHVLIYQLTKDYFFPNENLIIKTHPNDLMFYSRIFPDSIVIKEKFPSEFIPVIFTNKPKTIATISSTAINNLEQYFNNTFTLNFRYQIDFKAINRYYITLKLVNCFNNSYVTALGCNDILIQKLIESKGLNIDNIEMAENQNIYIVDDITKENSITKDYILNKMYEMKEEEIFIFINFMEDYCFYDIDHKELCDHIVPIVLRKNKINNMDNLYLDMKDEVIYICTKNERYKRMAEEFKCNIKLENAGVEIDVIDMTPDQRKIKILEGMLKATEDRLLYYIKKCQDMEDYKK